MNEKNERFGQRSHFSQQSGSITERQSKSFEEMDIKMSPYDKNAGKQSVLNRKCNLTELFEVEPDSGHQNSFREWRNTVVRTPLPVI